MKASVLVITYNQEKYIQQTLESVLAQKTDFDFEIIIGDDCSTDSTTEICKKIAEIYPDRVKLLIPKNNQGFLKNFVDCYNLAKGKYVGATAGDDYWIDDQKLQNQITFLEQNSHYSMVCSAFSFLYEDTGEFKEIIEEVDKDIEYKDLLFNNPIIPTTVVYHKELIPVLNQDFLKVPVEDWVLWLMYGKLGKIRYINKITAVYRQHSLSMYSALKIGKKGLWRFKTAKYINEHFRKQNSIDFLKSEKYTITTVLISNDLKRQNKIEFYNEIISMGFKKSSFLKLILDNNKVSNKITHLWLKHYYNKWNKTNS
jgi:glycosyltransferase involved in cell wall biosynthesis